MQRFTEFRSLWQSSFMQDGVLSGVLFALPSADLAHLCQVSSSEAAAVRRVWSMLLSEKGLNVHPESFPLSRLFSYSEERDDGEAYVKHGEPPQLLLLDWLKAESEVQSCLNSDAILLARAMVRGSLQFGLRALHVLEPSLAAIKVTTDVTLMPLAWALLLQHARSPSTRLKALEGLTTSLTCSTSCDVAALSDQHWDAAIGALCANLVLTDQADEAIGVLNSLADIFIASAASGQTSNWSRPRVLPPSIAGCRRIVAFAAAAAMVFHTVYSGGMVDGRRQGCRLLAVASELLTSSLPVGWGRGTMDSEDPVLRAAAKDALRAAECAKGGWACDGAPDVALRVASRRLRVKLGLRLG